MIDNVTITLNDCDCSLPLFRIGTDYSYSIYHLYFESKDINPAYLRIEYSQKHQSLRIIGSIRKWYLGMFSLSDLTKEQFEDAINKICEKLSISRIQFLNATLTNCEIGLNVQTRIPPQKVNEVVRGYNQFMYYRYDFQTVGFISENKKLKLYDKCTELIHNFGNLDKGNITKNHFEELKSQGIYTYRIEVTLFDNRSFNLARLQDLSTIGGLIDNYSKLISYWINECSKIEIGLGINFEDDRITKSEYAILVGIYYQGFDVFLNAYLERSVKGRSKSNSKANARYTERKKIGELLTKYKKANSYNFASFRIDIYKTLKNLYGNFSTKELILGLWRKT